MYYFKLTEGDTAILILTYQPTRTFKSRTKKSAFQRELLRILSISSGKIAVNFQNENC